MPVKAQCHRVVITEEKSHIILAIYGVRLLVTIAVHFGQTFQLFQIGDSSFFFFFLSWKLCGFYYYYHYYVIAIIRLVRLFNITNFFKIYWIEFPINHIVDFIHRFGFLTLSWKYVEKSRFHSHHLRHIDLIPCTYDLLLTGSIEFSGKWMELGIPWLLSTIFICSHNREYL